MWKNVYMMNSRQRQKNTSSLWRTILHAIQRGNKLILWVGHLQQLLQTLISEENTFTLGNFGPQRPIPLAFNSHQGCCLLLWMLHLWIVVIQWRMSPYKTASMKQFMLLRKEFQKAKSHHRIVQKNLIHWNIMAKFNKF